MQHPMDIVIREAQESARKNKCTLYVIQDGLTTYGTMTPEDFAKNPIYPVKAIINPDGLIAAKDD